MRNLWPRIRQPHAPEGAWLDYHENSKATRHAFSAPRGDAESRQWMYALERRPFQSRDLVELPPPARLDTSLDTLLERRRSERELGHVRLTLESISALLHAGYGITRHIDDKVELRTVPSAGAMYPLELFLALGPGHAIDEGLYNYLPQRRALFKAAAGDQLAAVSTCMAEPEIGAKAAAVVLIGAVFERTMFKYGERGYRFVLLEAGHLCQNLQLASAALGYASVPCGGLIDRDIDAILGFDGLQMSCIYGLIVGKSGHGDGEAG